MRARFSTYNLRFKQASGTSRGILRQKETYFLHLENSHKKAIGECNMFKGLSADDVPNYQEQLQNTCNQIHLGLDALLRMNQEFPSIQFGLEQAFLGLEKEEPNILFPSKFTQGKNFIPINGLIWMGNVDFMKQQILQKLKENFRCIKIKIGVNWVEEQKILQQLRQEFSANDLELRVDANGAFASKQATEILNQLADLQVHSIEQPIKQGQWQEMAKLCQTTPTPIALDEELIGIWPAKQKQELLQTIQPQYIILKPALLGGFQACQEWIDLCQEQKIGWWITSALESNIGLNAIAQFTYTLQNPLPQGLGTGGLFVNNLESNLELKGEQLWYNPNT